MDAPLITICIPIYRRTSFLKGCIEAALAQTADNFEIVVNDDTEDDSIRKIVESFDSPKIRYFHHSPPRGQIAKLNDFPDYARGEWLVFLCDDDVLLPGYIAAVTKQITAHPNAALVRVRQRLIDIDGHELRLDAPSPEVSSPFLFMSHLFRADHENFRINLTGVTFRKDLFNQIGRVKDIGRTWHIDRLAWAQMGALGDVVCDPDILCELRLHGSSITSSLDAEYGGAIDASMSIKDYVETVLADLDRRATTPEEKALLDKARSEFDAYMKRHLSRALDQGLLAALDDPKKDVRAELRSVEEKMRQLELPPFRSLRLYRLVAWLPAGLRSYTVSRLMQAKLKKRNSA